MKTSLNPNLLEYHWSATVILKGGQTIPIWWTCWPSIRRNVASVINISSDMPRVKMRKYV